MASSIMKRAVALQQAQQKNAVATPPPTPATAPPAPVPVPAPVPPAAKATAPRSALLTGVNVERWLGEQVSAHRKDKSTSATTKARYAQVALTLDVTRPDPWEAVDIERAAKTKNTFYAYRAAVRWSALERATVALRVFKNTKDQSAKKAAYASMLSAAADLARYPADAQPGLPSPTHVALGLADKKQGGEFKKAKAGPGPNDKLKDANTIQKIDGWRALVFGRLLAVNSPWIDHAAVAALTGCRPAEVASVRIEQANGVLVITIPGAKVSDTSGQPYRKFSIKTDAGPEFAYLVERVKNGPVLLSSDSTASAFSEALKRAGRQSLGDKAPPMTGYVYRHALACDMKADGADRDAIASALGHAVTKTQSHYGRATGGTKGKRVFQVEAARPIKQTHGSGHRVGRQIAPNAPAQPAPVAVFTSPGFTL
jgi:integrase